MKKSLLVFTLLIHFAFLAKTQTAQELPALGITPFYNTGQDSLNLSQELYEAVTRRLIQSKRFRVIDIPKRENALTELQTMRRREFIEREIIETGKSTPAQYLMAGFIRNSEFLFVEDSTREARVDVEVKYIDVKTGEAISAENFTGVSQSKNKSANSKTGGSSLNAKIDPNTFNALKKVGGNMTKDLVFKNINIPTEFSGYIDDYTSEVNKMVGTSDKVKILNAIDDAADQLFKWVLNTSGSNLYFLKIDDKKVKKAKNSKHLLIEGGHDVGLKEGLNLAIVSNEKLISPKGATIINEEPVAQLRIIDVRTQTSSCLTSKRDMKHIRKFLNEGRELRIIFELD